MSFRLAEIRLTSHCLTSWYVMRKKETVYLHAWLSGPESLHWVGEEEAISQGNWCLEICQWWGPGQMPLLSVFLSQWRCRESDSGPDTVQGWKDRLLQAVYSWPCCGCDILKARNLLSRKTNLGTHSCVCACVCGYTHGHTHFVIIVCISQETPGFP